jgi:twitching motility protein PilT
MIPVKVALKEFKAAEWQGEGDAELFGRDVEIPEPADVLKFLAVLQERSSQAEPRAHSLRRTAFAALAHRISDAELFVPFIEALGSVDLATRHVLVQLLPRVNNPARHDKLCALLGHRDPDMRKAAAAVLKEVAGRTALDIVVGLAAEPSFPGRGLALDIFVPKIQHHALPLIGAVLQTGSAEEQLHALKHLRASGVDKDKATGLRLARSVLESADERVVTAAIEAVGALASEDEFFAIIGASLDSPRLDVVVAAVRGLGRHRSPRVVQALQRKLREGPNAVRVAVVEAAQALATPEALNLLVDALGYTHIQVRTRAANGIAQLGIEGKVDVARAIVWLLRNRDVNVKRLAVEIVSRVGDPKGDLGPRLLELTTDEDWWVRERVMDALVKMWPRGLTRHIVGYLQDPSDVVRRFAVGALQRIKDPEALGALVRTAMSDADWWVRETAIECIADLKDARAVPYLRKLLAEVPETRIACVRALGAMAAKEASPEVAELLESDDPDLRLQVIECLRALDDRSQALWIKSCERDEDHRVRNAANELLRSWRCETDATADHDARRGLDLILLAAVEREADDVVIASGRPPMIKRMGKMQPLGGEPLGAEAVDDLLLTQLSTAQRQALGEQRDVDLSYEIKGKGHRFRVNVFRQLTGLSAVFRAIRGSLLDYDALGLPQIVRTFPDLKNGMVLVGGPTGSGKSTTLAALIDHINRTSRRHIITIEDPVEVVHECKQCLVNQREVGTHTRSFDGALRAALRQDPDVILVGEMRDLETIAFAVAAAETGHLVFGTVHTVSADTSIDRLINVFPLKQQGQVRTMLADSLRAVVCQHLLRRKDKPGRVLAAEVLIVSEAVASMIRNAKTFQIPQVLTTSRELGMQSMDLELSRLVRDGIVEFEEGYNKAIDKRSYESLCGRASAAPRDSTPGPASRIPGATRPQWQVPTKTEPVPPSSRVPQSSRPGSEPTPRTTPEPPPVSVGRPARTPPPPVSSRTPLGQSPRPPQSSGAPPVSTRNPAAGPRSDGSH